MKDGLKVDSYYLIAFNYFKDLVEKLKDNVIIATASINAKPVASTLLLFKGGIVHYWAAGSDMNYRNFNPNNLLVYESIKWAKNKGEKIFCLMGGSNKGLRDFKSSFSNTKSSFYTVNNVYDTKRYDYLKSIREKHKKIIRSDFFPLYRE